MQDRRMASAVRGRAYSQVSPEEAQVTIMASVSELYKRKGQSPAEGQLADMAEYLDTDIRNYYGGRICLEEIPLALDLGMHGEYGDYNGINADRLFRYVRAYMASEARAEALKEASFRPAERQDTEDVGRKNWEAMMRYTRAAHADWKREGCLPGLSSADGSLFGSALAVIRRRNEANAYRWLKAEGLVNSDAETLAVESRERRKAAARLGAAGTPRRTEELALATCLQHYFRVAESQAIDIPALLEDLDRSVPRVERNFF